jgi:two-component sensor histidine kinase
MPAAGRSPYRAGMQLRRWIQVARGRAGLVDGLLVLVVGAVQVLGAVAASGRIGVSPNWRPLDGWGYLLMIVGALALLVRRRWPLGVLAVTVAVSLAYASRAYPEGPAAVAVYPALYTVVTLVPRRRAWLAGLRPPWPSAGARSRSTATPRSTASRCTRRSRWWRSCGWPRRYGPGGPTSPSSGTGPSWPSGPGRRRPRRRVDEERMRIARELHDVVSHSIGVISVQAGVAAHLLHRRPDKAAAAVAAIRQASDEALGELHAMLGVLRDRDDGRAPLAPAPGLAQLDSLVAQASGAGIKVEVAVEGEPRRLPPAVDLACYRVVQESLTNVVRHAGASSAAVTVTHHRGGVVVEVTDDGRGPDAPGTGGAGQGIAGMRERAHALGGTLEAGPRPEGGFRVQASLPVGGTR